MSLFYKGCNSVSFPACYTYITILLHGSTNWFKHICILNILLRTSIETEYSIPLKQPSSNVYKPIVQALTTVSAPLSLTLRSTRLTSSLPRHGQTAASDITAPWRNWHSTATWWGWSGCRTPSLGTPRLQTRTGSRCLTSCSGYGTTAKSSTP